MSITFADFKPLTLDDKEVFLSQFSRFPPNHSDNSFINMVCWNHFAHYRYAKIGESILISSTIGGNTKFRPPIGPKNPDLLMDLFRTAIAYGDDKPIVLIEEDTRGWILEQYPKLPLYADRNYFEYVYRSDDLADLPGQKYQNIRRHRHIMHNFSSSTGSCDLGIQITLRIIFRSGTYEEGSNSGHRR